MKKYNLKYIGGLLLLCLSICSCSDFLETYPANSLVSNQAIENEEDIQTALRGAYQGLLSEAYYGCDFVVQGDVQGDDVQPISQGVRTENLYRFTARQNNAPTGLWSRPYLVINRVNVILNAIETKDFPATATLNDAKGQALALRALCHFNLLITYGYPYLKDQGASLGVSLVKEVLPATALPERSSVAEGYDMVIKDLTDALAVIGSAENDGHFNKWAVEALLARVNLYKGDWKQAFDYADDVIQNSPYTLIPNAQYVNAWKEEYTSESIFDLHISGLSAGNRELLGHVAHPTGYAALIATKDFIDLLNEDPQDVRLGLLQTDSENQKRFINKYPGRNGSVAVNNMRVLRLSDIYLIGAEAALKKPQPDQTKADEYLNAIIQRANPAAVHVTATEELVLKERRKELVMEGHRFFDAMRLGKAITRSGGFHFLNNVDLINPTWSDFRCVKPIPQAEIDVNHNIEQNPDYN